MCKGRVWFCMIAMILALSFGCRQKPEEPDSYANHIRTIPGYKPSAGTLHFVDALERVSLDGVDSMKEELSAMLEQRTPLTPDQANAIQLWDESFEPLRLSSLAPDIRLPAPEYALDPMPEFIVISLAIRTWILEAKRRAAAGDRSGAMARWNSIQQIVRVLSESDQELISQLLAINYLQWCERAELTVTLLEHKNTTAASINDTMAQFVFIESRLSKRDRVVESEMRTLRYFGTGLLRKYGGKPTTEESQWVESLDADFNRLADFLQERFEAELAKEYPDRDNRTEFFCNRQLADHESIQPPISAAAKELYNSINCADFAEVALRNDVALALIRMALIRGAEVSGVPANPAGADPFTGKPFGRDERGLFSVGPDGAPGDPSLRYDPTNGSFSPGDLW